MKYAAWKWTASACWTCACSAALIACTSPPEGFSPTDPRNVEVTPIDPPTEPAAEQGRVLSRLTATQLRASLELATGQTWNDFDEVAAGLGAPDYTQVTAEGRQDSPAVERILGDAADRLCDQAIEQDVSLANDSPERVLTRGVNLAAPTEGSRAANLRRLLLRFHAQATPSAETLAPYEQILNAPLSPTDVAPDADAADVEAARWQAICVVLALHPDFITY